MKVLSRRTDSTLATTWSAILTLVLLACAILAGLISYRNNWKQLSGDRARLAEAEGRGRREFMALAGVYLSIAIIWLAFC